MRILVTGATGFVGRHLAANLLSHGHELILTAPDPGPMQVNGKSLPIELCDITRATDVSALIEKTRPEAVVHLAAVSHVPSANDNRELLTQINVVGTHHICAALSRLPSVKLLFVSTAIVYGSNPSDDAKFDEQSVIDPSSAYGFSKISAEYVCKSYASEKLKVYIARPFNHTGPGQLTSFVCPALAKRVVECADGGTIEVGNLAARRDFSDVRDIVDAYRLILERAPDQSTFVLGSGKAIAISEVLSRLVEISGKKITPVTKAELLRKDDPPVVLANPALAERVLCWKRRHSIDETLKDLYRSF